MPKQWFILRDGREQGPFTSQKLKIRAATGTLRPNDLIRRDDKRNWIPASSVKGLFDSIELSLMPTVDIPAPRGLLESRDNIVKSVKGRMESLFNGRNKNVEGLRIAGILASIFSCCFPVGLILIWTQPLWTQFRKIFLTIPILAFPFSMVLLGLVLQVHAKQEIVVAHQLWKNGDKAVAIAKYRRNLSALSDEENPVIYGRIIEFDMEHGDDESADDLIKSALRKKIEPKVSSWRAEQKVIFWSVKQYEKDNPIKDSPPETDPEKIRDNARISRAARAEEEKHQQAKETIKEFFREGGYPQRD